MKIRFTASAFVLLTTFTTPALSEQQAQQTEEPENRRLPEEMMVTGERALYQLRSQLQEAEEAAYEMFNQFNDEARFNIHCRMHEPTGTRIKRQVCTPEFQLEATRAHAQDYINGTSQAVPMEAAIASQLQEYRSKMRQVAEEHPEFLEAIILYSEKREEYEAAISGDRE